MFVFMIALQCVGYIFTV